MYLKSFCKYSQAHGITQTLNFINKVRSNYAFAPKTYDEGNVEDVYLVVNSREVVGFINCCRISVELVVANENEPMIQLLEKFKPRTSSSTKNITVFKLDNFFKSLPSL